MESQLSGQEKKLSCVLINPRSFSDWTGNKKEYWCVWVHTLCQCRCAQPLWTCSRRRGTVVSAYSVSGSQSNILWKHCSSFPAERKETCAQRGKTSQIRWEHGDKINCNGRLNRRIKQIRNKKPEMNSQARGGLERRNWHAFYILLRRWMSTSVERCMWSLKVLFKKT